MMREMETWLSDSRVGNDSVVDHRRLCNFVGQMLQMDRHTDRPPTVA